jgi:hypothetical protein
LSYVDFYETVSRIDVTGTKRESESEILRRHGQHFGDPTRVTEGLLAALGDQQQYHNGVVPSLIVCYIVCYSSSRRAALQRKAQHIPLSSGLKGGSPGCLPVQYIAFLAGNAKRVAPNMAPSENAQELLRMCLQSIHHLSRPYFYRISGDESVPGTLSFLLGVKESDLIAMFLLCGFYHEKRGIYLRTVFKMWVAATFKTGTVKVTIQEGTLHQDWLWRTPQTAC